MSPPDVYIEELCRRTDTDIHWKEDGQGGYVAIANGARLRLHKWRNDVFLTRGPKGDETVISQPTIHISLSPIGKFLRENTKDFLGFAWPNLPETPREMADERLRLALDKLYLRVAREQEI